MPWFFQEELSQSFVSLSTEETKHITKSLRLKEGDPVWITDGKGTLAKASLANIAKNSCEMVILERSFQDKLSQKQLYLAVAPTKNPNRMEWLVEKAVEIGVSQIAFIICDRSERKHIDLSRLHRIAIAALKQSKGTWLPELKTVSFWQFLNDPCIHTENKFIACCGKKEQTEDISHIEYQQKNAVFLIGPEGDFTEQEVTAAKMHGFKPVSLGEKTLRTETAALLVACCFAIKSIQTLQTEILPLQAGV